MYSQKNITLEQFDSQTGIQSTICTCPRGLTNRGRVITDFIRHSQACFTFEAVMRKLDFKESLLFLLIIFFRVVLVYWLLENCYGLLLFYGRAGRMFWIPFDWPVALWTRALSGIVATNKLRFFAALPHHNWVQIIRMPSVMLAWCIHATCLTCSHVQHAFSC